MKILALETGGTATVDEAIVVALEVSDDDAQVAGVAVINEPRALGAQLIGAVDEVVKEAGWKDISKIDGLSLGSGPGSWTSLRVGFATWKTLGQTLDVPVVTVPSFDALSQATQRAILTSLPRRKGKKEILIAPHLLVTLCPCRPGELYGKLFQLSSEYLAMAQGERIDTVKGHLDAAFSQALADGIDAPLLLCGASAPQAVEFLTERNETELFQFLELPAEAVAIEIGLTGALQIASGEVPELADLEPLYLAPSNAERNLALKNGL